MTQKEKQEVIIFGKDYLTSWVRKLRYSTAIMAVGVYYLSFVILCDGQNFGENVFDFLEFSTLMSAFVAFMASVAFTETGIYFFERFIEKIQPPRKEEPSNGDDSD